MASKYLAEHFDIHCGGIDHVRVHHTNEIAQSECCYGRPWVNFWLHGDFLELDKSKMSKSSGSFLHLDQIVADGFSPLDYRYLLLTTHYRSRLRFSYENLEAAKRTRIALLSLMRRWRREKDCESAPCGNAVADIKSAFCEHLGNDLHLPEALAFAWILARDQSVSAREKLEAFDFFDRVFGLGLEAPGRPALSAAQASLIEAREDARRRKDWNTADRLRAELLAEGIGLRDGPEGPEWDISPDASR